MRLGLLALGDLTDIQYLQTKESAAAKKKQKKEKKLAKKNKRLGITTDTNSTNDAGANGSTQKKKSTPKDTPIASTTGATGVAANEGIASGVSTVTARRGKPQVEDVTDDE